TELFEGSGVTHQFAGALLPTNLGTIGVSVISLSSGKMTRTTEAYPLGGDPQYGGEFEWTATAIGLHYARRITDRLSGGVARREGGQTCAPWSHGVAAGSARAPRSSTSAAAGAWRGS